MYRLNQFTKQFHGKVIDQFPNRQPMLQTTANAIPLTTHPGKFYLRSVYYAVMRSKK